MLFPLVGKKSTSLSRQDVMRQDVVICKANQRRYDQRIGFWLTCAASLVLFSFFAHDGALGILVAGLLCMLFGIHTGSGAYMVPGGLLSGVGLGYWLTTGPLHLGSGDTAVGIFLLVCALGWFSIAVLSRVFTRHPQWWVLIPGGMMALTSFSLFI